MVLRSWPGFCLRRSGRREQDHPVSAIDDFLLMTVIILVCLRLLVRVPPRRAAAAE
jgi:hypothetical protein